MHSMVPRLSWPRMCGNTTNLLEGVFASCTAKRNEREGDRVNAFSAPRRMPRVSYTVTGWVLDADTWMYITTSSGAHPATQQRPYNYALPV